MDTIKAVMVRKLKQGKYKNSTEEIADYIVSENILLRLNDVCRPLPNGSPAGREFAEIISKHQVKGDLNDSKVLVGADAKVIVNKAISELFEKIMKEPDNLDEEYCDGYKHLRLQLVNAINQ